MILLTNFTRPSSGCNQIHGTDHNPFMKLVQETGTITYLPEDVHSIFLKDGKHLQGKEALNLWTAVEDLVAKGVSFSRTYSVNISEEISLWDWFALHVEKLDIDRQEKDILLQGINPRLGWIHGRIH